MTDQGEKFAFSKRELIEIFKDNKGNIHFNQLPNLIDLLMKVENDYQYVPKEFKNRRKRKGLRGLA